MEKKSIKEMTTEEFRDYLRYTTEGKKIVKETAKNYWTWKTRQSKCMKEH